MLKKIILCGLLASPVFASEDIADQYPALFKTGGGDPPCLFRHRRHSALDL